MQILLIMIISNVFWIQFQAEVKFLGKFSHPNLVRLLGYCWEDRQFLLMYEYMQKGSLDNHLFRSKYLFFFPF